MLDKSSRGVIHYIIKHMDVKPFVKWAGEKGQLLEEIDKNLPHEIKNGEIKKYFEPFVGGGAVFFYISQNYSLFLPIFYRNTY